MVVVEEVAVVVVGGGGDNLIKEILIINPVDNFQARLT